MQDTKRRAKHGPEAVFIRTDPGHPSPKSAKLDAGYQTRPWCLPAWANHWRIEEEPFKWEANCAEVGQQINKKVNAWLVTQLNIDEYFGE